jgi:hypothetical protein
MGELETMVRLCVLVFGLDGRRRRQQLATLEVAGFDVGFGFEDVEVEAELVDAVVDSEFLKADDDEEL